MILLSAAEQRSVELAASKLGVDVAEMIARAGKTAFEVLAREYALPGLAVTVLCGRGGNGADGFVIATRLKQANANPTIVLCAEAPQAEAPQEFYNQAVRAGVPVIELETDSKDIVSLLYSTSLVVDAVFGLGFKGKLPRRIEDLFAMVNQSGASVVSIDIPSGINADTGIAAENSICANRTLYVVGKKPAHAFKSSRGYCGELTYLDLELPAEAYQAAKGQTQELTAEIAAAILPVREETAHKWTFGSVICAVGSGRYRGAAVLCAKGALACGAGLVAIAAEANVLDAVAAHCPEAILLDVDRDADGIAILFGKASAFVVGCGLTAEMAQTMLQRTLSDAVRPVVIDAECLNALSQEPELLQHCAAPVILTPHVGEFARLVNVTTETVYLNRIRYARDYAVKHKVVLVLKSDNTLVALPGGEVYVNMIGNAGLAKGGSGDLLSGVIGSLCAMGIQPAYAAMLGVYLHSFASDIAVRHLPKHAMTASLVAQYLPDAISELVEQKN